MSRELLLKVELRSDPAMLCVNGLPDPGTFAAMLLGNSAASRVKS